MYIDENGLAEFTIKMKEYIDSKFAPQNLLLTANGEQLETADGLILAFSEGE